MALEYLSKHLEPPMPSCVWVCGLRMDVSFDDDLGFCHGLCSAASQYIKLNRKWCDIDYLREILLHEIIHAVDNLCCEPGIKSQLEKPPNPEGWRLTEPCVLGFSRGLWMTMTDPRNREVVEWMFAPSK